MSIAYTYFKYLIDREDHHRFLFHFTRGAAGEQLISSAECQDTGMTNKEPPPGSSTDAGTEEAGESGTFKKLKRRLDKQSCTEKCLGVIVWVLAFINIIVSIAVIAVTVSTALAVKVYNPDMSGRLVALVVLAVTAAVSLSVGVYCIVAVIRKKDRPLYAASLVLVIVVILQAIVIGVSIRVSSKTEARFNANLSESFQKSLGNNPRHVKIWDETQSVLECCGISSPEDYRPPQLPEFFPPEVPISCCSSYDSARPSVLQEQERVTCKAKREYYKGGCRVQVLEVLRGTAVTVLIVIVFLGVLEVALAVVAGVLARRLNKLKKGQKPQADSSHNNDGKPHS